MSAFDLRVYHVVEGQAETLQRVLRDLALPLMPDNGMEPIGIWAGPDGATFYQITRHASAEAVAGNWDRLHADPRWLAGLRAIRQERSAVRRVETIMLSGLDGLPPIPSTAGDNP